MLTISQATHGHNTQLHGTVRGIRTSSSKGHMLGITLTVHGVFTDYYMYMQDRPKGKKNSDAVTTEHARQRQARGEGHETTQLEYEGGPVVE
jgi:hypothetical protein